MASYKWSETTTTRRTYTLRTPAPYVELYKMLYGAEADYKSFHGLTDEHELFDNNLMVDVGDDEVAVYFEYPGTARTQARPAAARDMQGTP
ncbi:hypothetical protein [Catenulispora rubra]|uniref:hypothetical protein n=1 Tax=Catenulispora rubra TaxID=280293 RepID=UPI0018922998|nr:hypothetical protein [Catenulispora rubra]